MSVNLDLFFQGMADATLLLDRDGYISASNRAFEKLTGYYFQEISGKAYTILDSFTSEQKDNIDPLESAISNGVFEYQAQKLRKDKSAFWSKTSIYPIYNATKEIVGFNYSIKEETAYQAIALAHQEKEDRYRLMIEGVQDYAIYLSDLEGNIQTWNDGGLRMKGYSKEDIIGQNYAVLYNEKDRLAGKPVQDLELATLLGIHEKQAWRCRKDGTLFWARVVITALRNDANQVIGFSNVTQDLSDHQRNSDLLRESEEKYRSLVQQVTDYGIFMLDKNGFIVSWNEGASKIKGYLPHEIIGKHFSVFYPAEDIESNKPDNELKIAQLEGKYEEEGWRIRKNGSKFWANVVITPVYNPTRKLIGFSKVTRDLTERKRNEETLRRSFEKYRELAEKFKAANIELSAVNQELEQFTATVSHDLLEPLRTAKSFLYLVTTKLNEKKYEELSIYVDKSLQAVDRMKALIDSLLNYARVSKGEIDKKPMKTSDLIDHALSNLDGIIKQSGAHINLQIKATTIIGDSVQLVQLIQNLLSNSLKFIDNRAPIINITVEEHHDFVKFAIKDNGIGIETDGLEKIFDVFRRLHTVKEYPGTGIGLALCKRIVERHNGRIWIESKKGVGTTFFFTIGESLSVKK